MNRIETVEQLASIYGEPAQASLVKVTDYITPHYGLHRGITVRGLKGWTVRRAGI